MFIPSSLHAFSHQRYLSQAPCWGLGSGDSEQDRCGSFVSWCCTAPHTTEEANRPRQGGRITGCEKISFTCDCSLIHTFPRAAGRASPPPIVRGPIFLPDRASDRPGFTGDLGNFFLFWASLSQSETWVQHPGELKLLVKARAAHPYLQEHPGSPAPSDPSQDKLQSPRFKLYSALISCEILGTSLPSLGLLMFPTS